MTLPYCIVLFPQCRAAACLDRQYNYIPDTRESPRWKVVQVGDIVTSDNQAWYPGFPPWAERLRDAGYPYTILWTRFYDGGDKNDESAKAYINRLKQKRQEEAVHE